MQSEELGRKIKELRGLRGMSQEYLAEESRLGLRTIQRIENNESNPTGETIKRIAAALGADIKDLLGPAAVTQTKDLDGTLIFLKKKRAQSEKKTEIKTFENFIAILEDLKDKDLSPSQSEGIQDYIQYLELDKIPSFSHELYRKKLKKFRGFLRTKLRFVPRNFYGQLALIFAVPFTTAFAVQPHIEMRIKLGVVLAALLLIGVGLILDLRIKKQNRSLRF